MHPRDKSKHTFQNKNVFSIYEEMYVIVSVCWEVYGEKKNTTNKHKIKKHTTTSTIIIIITIIIRAKRMPEVVENMNMNSEHIYAIK